MIQNDKRLDNTADESNNINIKQSRCQLEAVGLVGRVTSSIMQKAMMLDTARIDRRRISPPAFQILTISREKQEPKTDI